MKNVERGRTLGAASKKTKRKKTLGLERKIGNPKNLKRSEKRENGGGRTVRTSQSNEKETMGKVREEEVSQKLLDWQWGEKRRKNGEAERRVGDEQYPSTKKKKVRERGAGGREAVLT